MCCGVTFVLGLVQGVLARQFLMLEIFPIGMDNGIYGRAVGNYSDFDFYFHHDP